MSGIVGIFYRDGRLAKPAVLEKMLSSIGHRGPNGRGIWCGGEVGLGQCMLCTTPELVHDRQPRLSLHADLILVADARIDNRDEMIKALAISNRPALEIPDSQIILSAYQKWGAACPEKLVGDYAFAIWDIRNKQMFCARDAVGVKPLYYYLSGQYLAFASEIKALLTLSELPRRLNEKKIADYLLWSFEDTQATFYSDILRLKPAHTLNVTLDDSSSRRYWSLDPHREIHLRSRQDYIEAFKDIFTDSVQARMRSILPIGSTLSGGLDSSSIACTAQQIMARNHGGKKIQTVSAIFQDLPEPVLSQVDERDYISTAINDGGYHPVFVYPERISPLIDLQDLYHVLDEPFFTPTQFLFWTLYQGAKEAGIGVLLDGTDGDSTVSHGEEYLLDLSRSLRWMSLYREAAYLANVERRSVRSTVWNHVMAPILPAPLAGAVRRHRGTGSQGWTARGLLSMDFARRVGINEKKNHINNYHHSPFANARYKHYVEMTSGSNSMALELFDKLSAAFSLEVRFPFFDRRLMEFCLALPPDQILYQGWTRYILRAAMQEELPASIQWRTSKANLPAAFSQQLFVHEQRALNQAFLNETNFLCDYIDPTILKDAYLRYRANPPEHIMEAYSIFGALTLQYWLNHSMKE